MDTVTLILLIVTAMTLLISAMTFLTLILLRQPTPQYILDARVASNGQMELVDGVETEINDNDVS